MMPTLLLLTTLFSIFFSTANSIGAGTITGEVKFVDSLPKPVPIKVTKDQDYCGESLPNETYLVEAAGGLKNVVVFVESAPNGKAADPQKENFLYNDGCRYAPRVLALQKGERLRVRSHDPKLHIPHGYLGERTVFNLSLPFKNTTIDATAKIREVGIMKVVCDTHAWMMAYIHVQSLLNPIVRYFTTALAIFSSVFEFRTALYSPHSSLPTTKSKRAVTGPEPVSSAQ